MKKAVSLVITFILLFGIVSVVSYADDASGVNMKFDKDGKFTILHLADCQDNYPAYKEMFDYINLVLDEFKPDLVVLGGDNTVAGLGDTGMSREEIDSLSKEEYDEKVIKLKEDSIKELVTPFVEHNTYFTLVFGNHDHQQFGAGNEENKEHYKEILLSIYQKYGGKYCLAYDDNPQLYGVGTHNIPIYSNDGSKIEYNLYMFDSNTYYCDENGKDLNLGYDAVHTDEINWYKDKRDELKELTGNYVPSIAFQHIIVGDIYDALYVESPFSLGELGRDFNDKHYSFIPKTQNFTGYVNEPPCPGYKNYGQLDAMAEKGDTQAIFSGHDHTNDFTATIKGVDIVNTPAITYNSYSSELNHGARLITVDENSLTYSTKVIKVNELAVENDDYAKAIGKNKAEAYLFIVLDELLTALHKAFIPFGYLVSIFG